MRGMKLPRFSLRTLLVMVGLIGVSVGWALYQRDWIRQRREFQQTQVRSTRLIASESGRRRPTPWSLRLFGQGKHAYSLEFFVEESQISKGRSLFPEADFFVYRPEDE
jgi:hypothetical protein